MDGTLLASDKSIPAVNLRALDVLGELGIPFVPCTGRPVSAVPRSILGHDAVRYAIAANGAVVIDLSNDVRLRVRDIAKDSVLGLYERVCDWPLTFDVFADGVVYSERKRYESMGTLGINPATLAMLRKVRQPTDLTVPQIVAQAQTVEKITCFFGDVRLREALEAVAVEVGGLACASGDPSDLELMAPGTSKGDALAWLCGHVGVAVADAVAFGDEQNDASMLVAAGDGVAMANATSEVVSVADHVADSNDEGGVGRYLLRALGLS